LEQQRETINHEPSGIIGISAQTTTTLDCMEKNKPGAMSIPFPTLSSNCFYFQGVINYNL